MLSARRSSKRKEEAVKSFSVWAFFPEVKPAHAAIQSCVAKATEMNTAVSRAIEEIRARPALRGKRIREVRLTIKELHGVAAPEQ